MTSVLIVVIAAIVGWYLEAKWKDHKQSKLDELCLVLDNTDGWFSEATVDPKNNHLHFYSRTPDHASTKSQYQYRFDGSKLWIRAWCVFNESISGNYYSVRNGVVDEMSIKSYFTIEFVLEEILKTANEDISWQEVKDSKLVFFVASKHPGHSSAA